MALVALMSLKSFEKNLVETEANITNALIAKGRTLIGNNSQALTGMVDDNAFSSVLDLVSTTVNDDADIVYGIYMDEDLQPWVHANTENPEGKILGNIEFDDELSLWASELEKQDYKVYENEQRNQLYEFAAPVVIDDEILGHIRYGFTTKNMVQALSKAKITAENDLINTLGVLLLVGMSALVFGYVATRKMAQKITQPLDKLTDAASNIAKGDYENTVDIKSNDEIGVLSNNFNLMRHTIKKKMKDLSELNDAGEALSVIHDQRVALEEVLKTMNQHCNVIQGSIYLFNKDSRLVLEACFPPKSIDNTALPKQFKAGEGVIGHCVKTKAIIYVENTLEHELFVDKTDTTEQSLLCVPLVDNDIVFGAMNFSGDVGEVLFEESDREYASSLARSLVNTIKNINMREVIEEQNRTLEHKVEERTSALKEKTNDILNMMHNMHQGLFTIVEGNLVHPEYAAYLEEIFETKNIANRDAMQLLFEDSNLGADVLNQVETGLNALIGEDEMMFEFNQHCLILEYTKTFEDNRVKILELAWDPIISEGVIDKIMVTVRDVTELKALQAEAEEQKRELDIIGQIISVGKSKFREFILSSRQYLISCRDHIQSHDEKDLDIIGLLFRDMHTIKGNSRTYGFSLITDTIHYIESNYDQLRKDPEAVWNQDRLLADLESAEDAIEMYANTAETKLDLSLDDQQEVGESLSVENYQQVNKALSSLDKVPVGQLPLEVVESLNTSLKALAGVEGKPLSLILEPLVGSMPSLCEQLSKPLVNIIISDNECYFRRPVFQVIMDVFTHIIRNSVDHGIESKEIRRKQGKSLEGTIKVVVDPYRCPDVAVIEVYDDGQGLDLDKLRKKGVDHGLWDQHESVEFERLAELIFHSGISTAQALTQVSGRGVGMDAVKGFIENIGGKIDVEEQKDVNNDSKMGKSRFKIMIYLPMDHCIKLRSFDQLKAV